MLLLVDLIVYDLIFFVVISWIRLLSLFMFSSNNKTVRVEISRTWLPNRFSTKASQMSHTSCPSLAGGALLQARRCKRVEATTNS
jgi:hypothetical protein